jgi:hypothetical protein
MKTSFETQFQRLCLVAVIAGSASLNLCAQEILVRPARGGGQDTNAPMIHVDIFYDEAANEMQAILDTSHGIPHLLPLPEGYGFATSSNYTVLTGKAYNLQYAWNPGGIFTPPGNAAVWIECLSASSGLENYDGPGNKNENPPRPYTPILGTAGSPTLWPWYGRMAHNAFAILNPTTDVLTAEYRVFFGDAVTGARDAFLQYDDATVTLTWTVDPVPPPLLFSFGASDGGEPGSLAFLNASEFDALSGYVVSLYCAETGPFATQFECEIPMVAVPATAAHGGPVENHAALGACLHLELVSLVGPAGGSLSFWEPNDTQPRFTMPVGEIAGMNFVRLSESGGEAAADPYGCIQGRLFTVSQPGLYRLGFRLVDSSSNGVAGGPVHPPSELYHVCLQAGVTLHSLERHGLAVTATFGGLPGTNFYLERAATLDAAAPWTAVAGPLRGMSRLQTLIDPAAAAEHHFYRLRTSVP